MYLAGVVGATILGNGEAAERGGTATTWVTDLTFWRYVNLSRTRNGDGIATDIGTRA